ncbi:MAG: penicillin-binding protein 2 [Eubacterium sp.]|nr:penicillin-binding protein 2 [Eubacterium sp.]
MDKENQKKSKRLNREMAVVTYLFMIIFIVMAGYLVYFVIHDSEQVLNNPQNKRQTLMAKRVKKGSILSDDGKTLAVTKTTKNGEEVRSYPYGSMFAHVVGHTTHGATGLESTEGYTMLTSGINPIEGVINELKGEKNPGNNVVTTLNVKLTKLASEGLGSKKGAVLVMDPETGKILVMLSKPSYDPNNLSDKQWENLTSNSSDDSPLYNRVTQGLYPPGSTFKLYTALEYMRENKNYNKLSYTCNGKIGTGESQISCYNGEVHGVLNLQKAFAESCNVAFCQIGSQLDRDAWKKTCETFFYNKEMPIDKINQNTSKFNVTKDTATGDVMQASIGQGDTLVTPLQNAFLVAAAVNQGKLMKPYLVDRVEDFDGNVVKQYNPEEVSQPLSEKEAKALKKLMRETVKSGTATSLSYGNYTAGGKTGSAEFHNGSTDSHAWFVGYGEKNGKKLVVSIVVEAAGTGSAYAVPIAKRIFDAYW